MKKVILLLAFTLGLIVSANAQKFSFKLSVPNSISQLTNHTTSSNRYTENRNKVSVGGSIEFSKKGGTKFTFSNTQQESNTYPRPLNRKELEKEKEITTEIIQK